MGTYEKIAVYMADGQWHSTPEIANALHKVVPDVHRALMQATKYRCVEKGDIVLENARYVRMWRLTP